MDKIVYILGAGFSAPLGLPVMSNFLSTSKDLYFSDPERYKHFLSVINTINKMSFAKNTYDSDQHNIEEILSILEMGELVGDNRKRSQFIKYIEDVIESRTPHINEGEYNLYNRPEDYFSSMNEIEKPYARFVGNILGCELKSTPMLRAYRLHDQVASYSVG